MNNGPVFGKCQVSAEVETGNVSLEEELLWLEIDLGYQRVFILSKSQESLRQGEFDGASGHILFY
ncbi:hypothetical protein BHYA_0004g00800 [Botrytis hyacinthi]|uniref:Uncharacterized protein n=1 Tax=Botrytis hyacinthi TaxID=278943 RepID=A0A4Z1H160_9HELO|nr:hypothetical protein BHYA_0004g00800 [Botrytis hyacinthi]